jgi:hypothetical protein
LKMSRKNSALQEDERRQLVQRMVSSNYLSKSARLSEMFLYLCDRVLSEAVADIHEQEVGREVFGRPVNYDTSADNIVRVHASMLRKRIDQYFNNEGVDEPIVVDIPKGNYAPVFRNRTPVAAAPAVEAVVLFPPGNSPLPNSLPSPLPDPPPDPVPDSTEPDRRARSQAIQFSIPLVILAVLALSMLFLHRVAASNVASRSVLSKPIRQFWLPIFQPSTTTSVVLDDAAVALYQELTGDFIPVSEYFDRSYMSQASEQEVDLEQHPIDRALLQSLLLRRQSSYEEVGLVPRFDQLATALHAHADVRFARDFTFREVKGSNVILLGNRFSNPWIQLFERHLSLQWRYDRTLGSYYPVDTLSPDPDHYRSEAGKPHDSYATVALLPDLSGNGKVLIISGTGGTATSAAFDFLTDDHSLQELQSRLHSTGSRPLYFDVLLRVERRSSLPRDVTILLARAPQP